VLVCMQAWSQWIRSVTYLGDMLSAEVAGIAVAARVQKQ